MLAFIPPLGPHVSSPRRAYIANPGQRLRAIKNNFISDGWSRPRWEQNPTSSNRFTSLCALTNSVIFPLAIHSETIAKSFFPIVTPISGSTFGWQRLFHVTTSLQNVCATTMIISSSIHAFDKSWVVTHARNLVKITCRVYLQNLDCNLVSLMFSHPHISVPATVQCFLRSVKTNRDLKWTRKQSVVTAYLVQSVQTPPLEPQP